MPFRAINTDARAITYPDGAGGWVEFPPGTTDFESLTAHTVELVRRSYIPRTLTDQENGIGAARAGERGPAGYWTGALSLEELPS